MAKKNGVQTFVIFAIFCFNFCFTVQIEEENEDDLKTHPRYPRNLPIDSPSPSLFTSELTKMQGSLWLRVPARCRKTL